MCCHCDLICLFCYFSACAITQNIYRGTFHFTASFHRFFEGLGCLVSVLFFCDNGCQNKTCFAPPHSICSIYCSSCIVKCYFNQLSYFSVYSLPIVLKVYFLIFYDFLFLLADDILFWIEGLHRTKDGS